MAHICVALFGAQCAKAKDSLCAFVEIGITIPGMSRFANERIRGSLWGRGPVGMAAGVAVIVLLLVRYSAIRWFLGISVVIGVVIALGLSWYHQRVPIKDPHEDKVVLHLNDDEPPEESSDGRRIG
jgi:hypothetical protein